ncbi:MAG: trypsin-like peptidase domain-containing protein [Planctomycetes bacterium]|nr:trypsin-like peptidase domain-containing protein [Planctomycetota bacterium]
MLSLFLALAAALPQDSSAFQSRWTPEAAVARDARISVVYIESSRPVLVGWNQFNQRVYRDETRSGSGVVVEPRGYIITNYHVVGDDAREITVQFDTLVPGTTERSEQGADVPRKFSAKLLSSSRDQDLALLKVDSELSFTPIRFGTSSDLILGERVVAIGNPLGQRLTVSAGLVSGLGRDIEVQAAPNVTLKLRDLIQTDAAINHGNSGGPLLNILGEMIGINTLVNEAAENMGFAIPVDHIEEVLRDQLLAPESSRAWFGFEVDEAGTLCINRVIPGSPAADAGIEVGYRLVAIDGQPLQSAEDYRLQRVQLLPNKPARFRIKTAEGEREYELKGWKRADGVVFDRMGMTVDRCVYATGRIATQTICVVQVGAEGPAKELGLQPGDIIDAVRAGETGLVYTLTDAAQLARLLAQCPSGSKLEFDILRDEPVAGRASKRRELYKGSLTLR